MTNLNELSREELIKITKDLVKYIENALCNATDFSEHSPPASIIDCEELMKPLVSCDAEFLDTGEYLKHASDRLKDTKEMVLAACSLQYASERLKDDEETVNELINWKIEWYRNWILTHKIYQGYKEDAKESILKYASPRVQKLFGDKND